MNLLYDVVIPTYNEQRVISLLLDSITKQSLKPAKIIVADNFSIDSTRQIVRQYGAQVVDGGNQALGRNQGFTASSAPYVVFIDSDVILPSEIFMMNVLKQMQKAKLGLGLVDFMPTPASSLIGKISIWGSNLRRKFDKTVYRFFKKVVGGSGAFMIFARSDFEKLSGFNPNLIIDEDRDIISRAAVNEIKIGFLNAKVFVNPRRYNKANSALLIQLAFSQFCYKSFAAVGLKRLAQKIQNRYQKLRDSL